MEEMCIRDRDKTARNGEWREGPGMDLFNALEKKLGRLNIIVEDLGYLTPSVKQLLKDTGCLLYTSRCV